MSIALIVIIIVIIIIVVLHVSIAHKRKWEGAHEIMRSYCTLIAV